ncbi:hypothetical protein NSQ59_20265 [Margalitia sp. FSL K6-0131]|uniref:hypothetical protein n=1 Tax=Margalitia sp. FSL K6-0131 TaxID=2954604 RepID=UPI0030F94677
MTQQKVIIFLPAYYEEESIAEVIGKIPRSFNRDIEIQVVSSDGTVQAAYKAGAD